MTRLRDIKLILFVIATALLALLPTYSYATPEYSGRNVIGSLDNISSKSLLPEGTDLDTPRAVRLSKWSSITVDLHEPEIIKAVLIQADQADEYQVQASIDGTKWKVLWEVPTVYMGSGYPPMGMRTRTKLLDDYFKARYIRVVPLRTYVLDQQQGVKMFTISRFLVYSEIPSEWPPSLDYSLPRSRPPLLPMIDIAIGEKIKLALAVFLFLSILWSLMALRHGENRIARGVRRAMLVVLLILSVFSWPNFMNFHFGSVYHIHDIFHYYIGSKYFDELGYKRIYECTVIAEAEDGILSDNVTKIRNLSTNSAISTREVLDTGRCKDFFTKVRWDEFKSDIKWFRKRFSNLGAWDRVKTDYGFNATPAWLIIGRPVANHVSATEGGISFLAIIDMVLLMVAVLAVLRTFGLEAGAAFAGFFAFSGFDSFLIKGGSFIQYGWFFFLAIGLCSLYANRNRAAGAFLTVSAFLRIFPVVVLSSIFVKCIIDVIASRDFSVFRRYRNHFMGVAVASVIIIGLSLPAAGGPGSWMGFIHNSTKHVSSRSTNFMGLSSLVMKMTHEEQAPAAVSGDNDASDVARKNSEGVPGSARYIRLLLVLMAVVIFFWVVHREDIWVIGVLSVVLVYVIGTLSDYYFVIFAFAALLWPRFPWATLYLSLFACMSWLPQYFLNDTYSQTLALSFISLVFIGVLVTHFALTRNRPRTYDPRLNT